jgi:trehalose 6-phosphate phosphatase
VTGTGRRTTRPAATSAASILRDLAADLGGRPILIVSDFDGTLSRVHPDPWAATILPLARRALRALAGRPGVIVAILSGRTAPDVAGRARIGGARYLGNHGLERGELARRARAEGLLVTIDEEHAGNVADSERLAAELPGLVPDEWLVVERKPPAVAFHFRAAPDVGAAAARVADAVERLDPGRRFERLPGRRVLELRPVGAIAKGQAMRTLLEELRPRLCFCLGDDRSDAEAFRELRAAREAGRVRGLALAVQARDEVPADVAAAADHLLASPFEAARFLSGLARRIGPLGVDALSAR